MYTKTTNYISNNSKNSLIIIFNYNNVCVCIQHKRGVKMVDECSCRWKLLLISMIVLCSFFVSALDITFLSPSDGDTVASAVTINITTNVSRDIIVNVSFFLRENLTANQILFYSTSSATFISASDCYVSYDFNTDEFENGDYILLASVFVAENQTEGSAQNYINITINNIEQVNCWGFTTQNNCIDNDACRWDFWGKNCYQVGCWDFWENNSCDDAANVLGLACEWNSGGSNGWCGDGAACWANYEKDSCDNVTGCTWDGQEYCMEKNCWNYNTQDACNSHLDLGCVWDGWSCMEQSGCWAAGDEDTCGDSSGCIWNSDEWCAEEGCWNYDSDEDDCNAASGCEWFEDQWGSFCQESGSCWGYNSESGCESAGCYWDDPECMFLDCFILNQNECENNDLGLDCNWSSDWGDGECEKVGCWDYQDKASCISSNDCQWDGYSCFEGGCWDARNSSECGEVDGCTWMSGQGWCEDENCWSYNDETSCEDSSLGCAWGKDQWGSWCYEVGCWDLYNETACLTDSRCQWDAGGAYCYEVGCWDYQDPSLCDTDSNCEWGGSGYCAEGGCWSYNNLDDCNNSGSCTWGGSGWCTDEGCWNHNTKLICDEHSGDGCQWNDQGFYCEEIWCGDLVTEASCDSYSASLDCYWDNYWLECRQASCGNYWDETTCGNDNNSFGDGNCAWQTWEGCEPRECWNYDEKSECDADDSCNWEGYCEGDSSLECWNSNDETNCTNRGCKWIGNCYEEGCWSNSDREQCCGSSDCTESTQCGWEISGQCENIGCWTYYNVDSCENVSMCDWDNNSNYCYEKGCWDYNSSSLCGQQNYRNCFWNEEENYCYKKDCWQYGTEAQCNADSDGLGNCDWNDYWGECYSQGCWANSDQTTCSADATCQWTDSGWCYDIGCWNYGVEGDCEDNSMCTWDSTWDYCYEKGCWDYSDEGNCTTNSKCLWDAGGNYCYEAGCWNYDNVTCEGDYNDTCFWEDSSNNGWCYEEGCWDKYNIGDCEGEDGCLWDSTWNYCYESGCGGYGDESNCESSDGCYWDGGNNGWCYEESCWDYWDQTSCEGNGCQWDSDYDYCYEEGCWKYDEDEGQCNAAGSCSWMSDNWGWCEEVGCWNYNTQNDCESSTGIDCAWNSNWNYCEEVSCYIFDFQGADACENNSDGLDCEYENGWCDPAGGFCSEFEDNKKGCMDTFYCAYDFNTGDCNNPNDEGDQGFAEKLLQFNPECWIFDYSELSCNNTNICVYSVATDTAVPSCDNNLGYEDEPVQCENITEKDLCNTIPALASCCRWRNGSCTTDYTSQECRTNQDDPGEGMQFCEDYNVKTQSSCEKIAGSPWFMPCKWSGKKCTINLDDIIGSEGDFFDIKTESLCEDMNGEWACEYYCDDKSTADTADDKLKTECWCKPASGNDKFTCDKSCWACEEKDNGSAWIVLENAQSACEGSAANCEFMADSKADNGFGYCDFNNQLANSGSCDTSCDACNDVVDNPQTKDPETKIACIESQQNCKWKENLANKSEGTCIDESVKTCSDKCSKCSKEECESNGLGTTGSCDWDTDGLSCSPANSGNNEECSDKKDNDNDGNIDCKDSDCFFDDECGGGAMHECWKYDNDEAECNSSAIFEGASTNCIWIVENFGGEYCGHPGEVCKMYSTDPIQCESQNQSCKYKYTGGSCDINQSKMQSCFGRLKKGCTGDCQWTGTESNGKCEYKMFAVCHDSDISSQSSCTSGTNAQYCTWMYDKESSNGGRCEPKCFNLDNNSCNTNAKCEWIEGWCESNMITSDDCYEFDNTNRTTCEGTGACTWSEPQFSGESGCEPQFGGVYMPVDCWDKYQKQSNCNADANCTWIPDPYADAGGFCDNKAFACYEIGKMAVKNSQDPEVACNASAASGCVWDPLGFIPPSTSGACVSVCEYNTAVLDQECNIINGCQSFTGWCNPKGAGMMFEKMDAPPVEIAFDECDEEGVPARADICGMGVKDDIINFGVGIGVRSMENSSACNGEYIFDFETGSLSEGKGEESTKTEFYLNSDGVATGQCSSSNSVKSGLDYKFVLRSTVSDKEDVTAHSCVNGVWTKSTTIGAYTMANIICGVSNGPIVMIDKNTLGDRFDTSKDFVIYVLTANVSTGDSFDAIEGKYTPGSMDQKKEMCSGLFDTDGDGLPPDKDPDCKFKMKFGGDISENCFEKGDEDLDGFENCDDTDCKNKPICGGNLFDIEVDVNDTTSASIDGYDINTFPDGAFIEYDSSEPANGTLLFYHNDSRCKTLNATVYDVGIMKASVPEYRKSHDGPIDEQSINYALTNDTTYFFKLKVCDKAGNPCGYTACLNFTTEENLDSCGIKCEPVFDIEYVPPEGDDYLGGAGTQWDFGEGYEDKPCGGLGGFKKNYGETGNVGFKISNGAGFGTSVEGDDLKWSIGFENMSIKGTIDSNRTRIRQNEISVNETSGGIGYVGMDTTRWEAIKDELNPKFVTICVPGNVEYLYHCDNESAVSEDDCTDVTSQVASGPTYNSALDCTEFTISADLGFSVYFGSSTPSDDPPRRTSSGGGSASCISDWDCTDWEECANGWQERECVDLEECVTPSSEKPETEKKCTAVVKKKEESPITGLAIDDKAERYMQQFEEKQEETTKTMGAVRKIFFATIIVTMVLMIVGMFLTTTFAVYKSKKGPGQPPRMGPPNFN